MQRKAYRRCLAFCSSKDYKTKPTAHLQPFLIFSSMVEHLTYNQKDEGSSPLKSAIRIKQKSVGVQNENALIP